MPDHDLVSFGGRPIVRFLDVPPHRDLQQWAEDSMSLLGPAGFPDWVDMPVFFINPELMDMVAGSGNAVGVLDRVADNLVPAYDGKPPLPSKVYDELDEAGGVVSIGLNAEAILADEDPEYAVKSTVLHEIAHAIHEAAPVAAQQLWEQAYDGLKQRYGDDWWAEHLFKYGPVEAFAELFAKQLLGEWQGESQLAIGRTFAEVLPRFREPSADEDEASAPPALTIGTREEEGWIAPDVWGWVGSGLLLVNAVDGFLLTLRSSEVDPPDVWGLPGGQVPFELRNSLDSIRQSAEIETEEELGSMPPGAVYTGRYVTFPDDFPEQLEQVMQRFSRERYPRFYVFRYDVPASGWEPDIYDSPAAWETEDWGWFKLDELAAMPPQERITGLLEEVTTLMQSIPRTAGRRAVTHAHPQLDSGDVEAWVTLAKQRKVSEVARSPRGFLAAWRKAGRDVAKMSPEWQRKREAFIKRHKAQLERNREPLWDDDGTPTRRHLALIMWAYSPTPARLREQVLQSSRKRSSTTKRGGGSTKAKPRKTAGRR